MHLEINFAVTHLLSLLQSNSVQFTCNEVCDTFLYNLSNSLTRKYNGHWDPYNPCVGSAYRAITCFQGQVDDLVLEAGEKIGISTKQMSLLLPFNFIIWVDPNEVSIRVGEYGYPKSIWSQKAPSTFHFTPKKSSPLRISSPSTKKISTGKYNSNAPIEYYRDVSALSNQRHESLMSI